MVRQIEPLIGTQRFTKLIGGDGVGPGTRKQALSRREHSLSEQRSELRAEVGRIVGDKLDRTPGLWRLSSSAERPVQLYIRRGFLRPDECLGLCRQIDSGSFPSDLYEKEKYEGARTSYSCNLNIYDPLVSEVETRIADLLGIERSWGEPLQGQRYQTGQQFKQHADFFYIDQPYWAEYEPHGGQRTWTAMIYLNIPESRRGYRVQIPRSRRRSTNWPDAHLEQHGGRRQPQSLDSARGPCRSRPAPNISSPNGTANGRSSNRPAPRRTR